MICVWKGGDPKLLSKKVGGLSLLERAALTAHAAGFKKVIYPTVLESEVREIQSRHLSLGVCEFIPESQLSFDENLPRLEWALDWVVWPQLLQEFLAFESHRSAVIVDAEGQFSSVRRVIPADEQQPLLFRSGNPRWPLRLVRSMEDLAPLAQSFYRALSKVTDGFVSRHFNRPVSIAVSSVLVRFGVKPSHMTTFCILLTVLAALMALSPDPLYLAVAGILFHIASTLDGCDGEIARLTFTGSEFGAWYDTLGDNARYGFFFACLGLRSYWATNHAAYLWTLAVFIPLMIYFVMLNARYLVATKSGGTFLVMANKVVSEGKKSRSFWDRFITPLQPFTKLDVQAFAVMVMCLVGLAHVMFWFAVVGLVFMTWSTVRTVQAEEKRLDKKITNHWAFFFLTMGSLVLVFLFHEVPLKQLGEALGEVGWGAALVFWVAPIWYGFNAIAIWVLCGKKISLKHLYYNHIVGEGYNNILPLASLAGEPFKVKHLSQFLEPSQALRVIVQDKLLNAQAGMVMTFSMGAAALVFAPIPSQWRSVLWICVSIMGAAALLLLYLMLSQRPSGWFAKVFSKFLAKNVELKNLSWADYGMAFGCRYLGRLTHLIEVALILYLLDLPYTWGAVYFLTFMISASGLVFFMVPQGIGVTEAGLAGAFEILGWASPSGLALALVRRARIVFWAVVGLALHLVSSLFVLRQSRALHASGSKI